LLYAGATPATCPRSDHQGERHILMTAGPEESAWAGIADPLRRAEGLASPPA